MSGLQVDYLQEDVQKENFGCLHLLGFGLSGAKGGACTATMCCYPGCGAGVGDSGSTALVVTMAYYE